MGGTGGDGLLDPFRASTSIRQLEHVIPSTFLNRCQKKKGNREHFPCVCFFFCVLHMIPLRLLFTTFTRNFLSWAMMGEG